MPIRLKKLVAVLMSALVSLPSFAQSNGNDLPDIGSPASSSLTLDDE